MRKPRFILLTVLVALAIPLSVMASGWPTAQSSTIASEQAAILPLFSQTASLIDPNFEVGPYSGSLFPPHFASDTDPFGYDRCDYWWNLIRPGWFTSIQADFPLDTSTREATAQSVFELWTASSDEVTVDGGPLGSASSRLTASVSESKISLEVNEDLGLWFLTGYNTSCLPLD